MRYSQHINLLRAYEWGLNLQQATLFAFIYELPSWASSRQAEDGQLYYFASHQKIIDELPILGMKRDTIYRNINKLIELGLLQRWVVDGKHDHYLITQKGKQWNSTQQLLDIDDPETPAAPAPAAEKITPKITPDLNPTSDIDPTYPGSESGVTPDLNPTNNIINNNLINYSSPPTPPGGGEVEADQSDHSEFDNAFAEAVRERWSAAAEKYPNACPSPYLTHDSIHAMRFLHRHRDMTDLDEWAAYFDRLLDTRFVRSMAAVSLRFALKDETFQNTLSGMYDKLGASGHA